MKSSSKNISPNKIAAIMISALLVLSCMMIFFSKYLTTPEESFEVVIHADGQEDICLPLNENTEITVESEGGYNTIRVEDKKAYIVEADCKNHNCIQQGAISTPGKQIVCLPHKLRVEIVDTHDCSEDLDKTHESELDSTIDSVSR